jgi:hypothetical protein
MNIAEQLQTIADNVPKVYQAGHDDGAAAGGGGGGDNYYDTFWDAYQQNGNRTNYQLAFGGVGWNDDTFNPKYTPITPTADMSHQMFYGAAITELKEGTVDFSQVTDEYMTFRGCDNLVRLPRIDFSNATGASWSFGMCTKLEEIECIVVNENLTYTNFFFQNSALEEVRFEGVIGKDMALTWSNLLSNESVQSIIDHLKDLTGATAQTLTFHATVGGKLTQAQKDAISAKNWTLAY